MIGDYANVSERSASGERILRKFKAPYFFYTSDPSGQYTSMFGDRLKKETFGSGSKFRWAKKENQQNGVMMFESDVRLEYKSLEQEYSGKPATALNVAFIDIESDTRIGYRGAYPVKTDRTDPSVTNTVTELAESPDTIVFDEETGEWVPFSKSCYEKFPSDIGWARPDNPYAIINAITIYRSWLQDAVTIAVCPPTMSIEAAEAAVSGMENTFVVEDEQTLLEATLDLLSDADVITGWNSEFYDLPYIIARIRIALGGEPIAKVRKLMSEPTVDSIVHLQKLCLFDMQPRAKEVDKFGATEVVYSLPGRPHLDYLKLYRKFILEEKFSYKLDSILKEEVNQAKVQWAGTFEDFYRNQFRTFCEYNRQDVLGLVALDKKKKFITLANDMAHLACVQMPDVLGSVAIIEQAVLLELHARGKIGPDKTIMERGGPVAGAFVYASKGGLYEWICSFDINSLYPSVIRLLNISPETLIGQFDTSATYKRLAQFIKDGRAENMTEAWGLVTGVDEYHLIADDGGNPFAMLTLELVDGSRVTKSGAEWNKHLRENGFALSANGTVFDTSEQGIVPYCMEKWFTERKSYQKTAKAKKKKLDAFIIACCVKKDGQQSIDGFTLLNDYFVPDGRVGEYDELESDASYWDRIQHVRKLFLNSTYGSLLNIAFRFGDERMGQSVTLSGRVIAKHMGRKACEIISGKYEFTDHYIAGDTDSAYVLIEDLVKEVVRDTGVSDPMDALDEIVAVADAIGEEINDSFPDFVTERFYAHESQRHVIKAGREVVGRRALFKNVKKRYAIYVVDKEGSRLPHMKIMGMETQRSDTPKFIQEFLEKCINMVVRDGLGESELRVSVEKFLEEFRERDPWTNGTPCRVSNITELSKVRLAYESGNSTADKPKIHYSVTAADNTNRYIDYYECKVLDKVRDGDKIQILSIKQDQKLNPLGFKSVGFPVDATGVPGWFKKLPIDNKEAENKLVHRKLENTFGVLGWDLRPPKNMAADVFTFA